LTDFNKIIDGKSEGELRSRTVYHRAVSFVSLKRYDDAKFDLRNILLRDANALAPRSLLAKAYKHTGDFALSEECLNKCITQDCDQADLFIERSYIRCRLGTSQNLKDAWKGSCFFQVLSCMSHLTY
jgi:tetratricopeptide (TPR) repeat protein